jgi:hypothetical protein
VLLAAWTISPAGQRRPELRMILEATRSRLGPWLASLPITSALVVAAAAGIAEELLFRGVLLALLLPDAAGLVLTSVLFGLLHAVTPTYAILAGLMGLWLGILQLASGNLLVPIITHAVYDLAALMMLRRVFRTSAG